ncbi:MAG: hypothetical protein ABL931_18805 [Usitatibacteraceae bacterium]
MSEIIAIAGAQIGPPVSYLIALTPLVIVFACAFAVAFGVGQHVENGRRGDDNSDSGDDPDFNDLENLRGVNDEWTSGYLKRSD